MTRTNITEIYFGDKTTALADLHWVIDYGQIIKFPDIELPFSYEVHFCNDGDDHTITMIGDANGVKVPDQFYVSGKLTIHAYIYLHTGLEDGETCYHAIIKLQDRPPASDEQPTPEEQSIIEQAIVTLNNAVEKTAADVETSDANALRSEGYAVGTQDGEPVEQGSPYYRHNALWLSQQAGQSANKAEAQASLSEAWAVGEISGHPVSSDYPQYHNNSKYYSEQAKQSAEDAERSAQSVLGLTAEASVDSNVGTPSVSVDVTTVSDHKNMSFSFHNLKGQPGRDGDDGYSPTVSVVDITGGHRVTITDKNGSHVVDVMDGEDGDPGDPGFSPVVSVTPITGGHSVSITDAEGTQTFDVMDGMDGAQIDGYYDQMTVGNAEHLMLQSGHEDNSLYGYRQTGGDHKVGVKKKESAIVGYSVVLNQIIDPSDVTVGTYADVEFTYNNDGSFTANGTASSNVNATKVFVNLVSDHVYLYLVENPKICITHEPSYSTTKGNKVIKYTGASGTVQASVYVASGTVFTNDKFYFEMVDLTMMFGSAIADYIVSLATQAEMVAWVRPFLLKSYYPKTRGTILNVNPVSYDSIGFNWYDEDFEVGGIDATTGQNISENRLRSKNYIPILPGRTYYVLNPTSGNDTRLFYYDKDKQYISNTGWITSRTVTIPGNASYLRVQFGLAYGTTYLYNACLSLDSNRNGQYERYTRYTYNMDSSLHLNGQLKLDNSNNLYCDGDIYYPNGNVIKRYKTVTFDGTETGWTKSSTYPGNYYKRVFDAKTYPTRIINTYTDVTVNSTSGLSQEDHCIMIDGSTDLDVKNADISTLDAFKSWLQNNPLTVVYELATGTEETANPYLEYQTENPLGFETYNGFAFDQSQDGFIPVGHNSFYYDDGSEKLAGLPSNFSTLIAPTEETFRATQNYVAGSYMIVNNVLYKADANIGNGETITPGTNVHSTTLTEELNSINAN